LRELIGHHEIIRGLQSGLLSGNLAHSFLFAGPSGIGKATVAHRYAQALLCTNPQNAGPSQLGCQQCAACHKVELRCHADLQWVEKEEGKTRISVDQIRELTRFLSLTPMESNWKVAIVDDAAQMNAAAANALLKTLEEPPANSVVILVTCRPGVLLATIRSRCMKYYFHALSEDDFARILMEKVDLAHDQWETVRDYSEGDLGFALRFVQEGQLSECHQLIQEMEQLVRAGSLGKLCEVAEYWSQANRFALAQFVIRQWIMEKVRDCVTSESRPQRVRAWLTMETFANEVFSLAETNNINKRLLLEGIFIKVLRISGAVL